MKSFNKKNNYIKKLGNDFNYEIKNNSEMDNEKNLSENVITTKETLLNIDSKFRVDEPKNIVENEYTILDSNPFSLSKDSNLVKVYKKNHKFKVEDKIIVKNVSNQPDIFSNGLIFFENSFYVLVYHKNHQISENYKKYNNTFEITISDVTGVTNDNYIDNIPINIINTIHDIIIYSDNISEILTLDLEHKKISDKINDYLKFLKEELPSEFNNIINNYYLIKLPIKYKLESDTIFETQTDKIGNVYKFFRYPGNTKIQINNLVGIPFNLINSDYPVNFLQKQGFLIITKIERDYFYFETNIKAYKTAENIGGDNVIISKVIKFIEGFPNSNNYNIQLKTTFYNVTKLELVSTEFPSTEKIIKVDGIKKNNVLKWQNIEDGSYVYSISIPKGNYNKKTLISKMIQKMNELERVISDTKTKYYHLFEINIDTSTDEVIFSSYKEVSLSKPFSIENVTINNESRIKLVITHPGNTVQLGDEIKISGAKSTNGISAQVLNTKHIVTEVDTNADTYSVILPKLNLSISTTDTSGGESVIIRVNFLVKFFFNHSDSLGSILGFRHVGKNHAITRFLPKISNKDPYELEGTNSVNLNSAGLEKKIESNILNFTGENLYIYMSINDYSNIITSNEIDTAFSKILLEGIPGDILFNTFVPSVKTFDEPIPQLNEIRVKFLYPDGSLVDFNNINHSFTLKITELIYRPKYTKLNTRFEIDNRSIVNLRNHIE